MEVWIEYPLSINGDLYLSWLDGVSDVDAAMAREDADGFAHSVVLQDTEDQYRTFTTLQPHLKKPNRLTNQSIAELSPEMQRLLIDRYYAFDEAFMLEIIGPSQLSSRLRKDLDDISRNVGISLFSSFRQFDNLKRIFKAFEDEDGRLQDMIMRRFLLQPALARDYAGLVFIVSNRLSVDKPNLVDKYTLRDFLNCSGVFMTHWTSLQRSRSPDNKIITTGDDTDLERSFLQELRELKHVMLAKDVYEEFYQLCCKKLNEKGSENGRVAAAIKIVFPGMLQIGAGLSHSRELRDLFEDIVDKIVTPCVNCKCSRQQLRMLFEVLLGNYSKISTLQPEVHNRFKSVFRRFVEGLHKGTQYLYNPDAV